jgi:hypothetical protein
MTTKKQFHITSFFTATKHATPEDRLKAVFAAEEAREQQCAFHWSPRSHTLKFTSLSLSCLS